MQENEEGLTRRERRELAKEAKKAEREKGDMASNMKKLVIWIGVGVAVMFLGYKAVSWVKSPSPQVAGNALEVNDSDWVKGDREAQVTLIEYGDFECPACVTYYAMVKQLVEEIPQGFRVVYRHFPLVGIHKNAMPAAQAAEAAGVQGKFWEMHDVLYDKHDEWEKESNIKDKLVTYARELLLDEEKFKTDYESGEVKNKVQTGLLSASRLGLNSTPSFFLNGVKIEPRSYEDFKKLIEEQLQK